MRASDNSHATFCYALIVFVTAVTASSSSNNQPECLGNGRFYRHPNRLPQTAWSDPECSKYFLCVEGEVFEFRCSQGLLFDVLRQICDFRANVDNCDVTTEVTPPSPLLRRAGCSEAGQMGCAEGTCLPEEWFCDGAMDCPDGSDEVSCDSPTFRRFAASPCNETVCKLPDCFCSKDGTLIPGDMEPSETPQMVLLTLDGAITEESYRLYQESLLTPARRNPNGCPIRATFYVSHQQNDYFRTQKLWNQGHEIAVHSVTHRGPEEWWSHNATLEDWFDEMIGQANILHKFAKVRSKDIRGLRVPFLKTGWNRQFTMMKEFGFEYDSSLVAPFSDVPLWPYTLDYKIPHSCSVHNQKCPSRPYPGLWEMAINQLQGDGFTCILADSCPQIMYEDEIYRMLMQNFKRHYVTNRAPLGLHFHASWFKQAENLIAFQRFLTDILKYNDVWFVTNQQAIEWMRKPKPLHTLNKFPAWDCQPKKLSKKEKICLAPNLCTLYSRIFQEERPFLTCSPCPQNYPWLRNEFGVY